MENQENAIWLRTICAQNGLQLSDAQIGLLEHFGNLLLDWNKKINLISRRDEENFWTSHILHSLSLLFKIKIPTEVQILDLGTGGGLPGIPLSIARPDLRFTLLDSTQKKINVVKEIVQTLGLNSVKAVWGRAEELGSKREHAANYDLVVARAVAPLKDLVRWSYPFLKRAARTSPTTTTASIDEQKEIRRPSLVTLKGGDLTEELSAIGKDPRIADVAVLSLALKGSAQLEEGDKKIVLVEFITK